MKIKNTIFYILNLEIKGDVFAIKILRGDLFYLPVPQRIH
jgi:hypothetical protein